MIFLDEIGELPLEMQAKLLRAIQDGEFYRVGGTMPVKTNVRIISATNRDLEKQMQEGAFRREDVYKRQSLLSAIKKHRRFPNWKRSCISARCMPVVFWGWPGHCAVCPCGTGRGW